MLPVILAALLMPGLGHVVLRRFRRAWLWLLAVVLGVAAAALTPWALLLAPAIGLAAIVDAARLARRQPVIAREAPAAVANGDDAPGAGDEDGDKDEDEDDEPDEDGYIARAIVHRPRVPFRERRWPQAVLLLVAATIAHAAIRSQLVETFKIPSAAMVPTLLIGDHIVAEKVSLRWRGPERGEVMVMRNPCSGVTIVKRVVAIGGDRVEDRCGALYVNDVASPHMRAMFISEYDDFHEETQHWSREACESDGQRLGKHSFIIIHDERSRGTTHSDHDFPRLDDTEDRLFGCGVGPIESAAPVHLEAVPGAASASCGPQRRYVVPAGFVFALGDNRDNSADSRSWGPVAVDALIGRVSAIGWSAGPDGLRLGRLGSLGGVDEDDTETTE